MPRRAGLSAIASAAKRESSPSTAIAAETQIAERERTELEQLLANTRGRSRTQNGRPSLH